MFWLVFVVGSGFSLDDFTFFQVTFFCAENDFFWLSFLLVCCCFLCVCVSVLLYVSLYVLKDVQRGLVRDGCGTAAHPPLHRQ